MISVIIPVFNCEENIIKCMDAILNQSYRNLEIIIVDYGSTDKTKIIAEAYQMTDHRVKVYSCEESNLQSARKLGFEISKGGFISFINGDDFIDHDYFKNLFFSLINNKADLSACSLYKEKRLYAYRQYLYNEVYSFRWFFDYEYEANSISGKLFKRRLLKNLNFNSDIYCDDRYLLVDVFAKNPIVVFDDTPYYYLHDKKNNLLENEYIGAINSMLHLVKVVQDNNRIDIYRPSLMLLQNTIIDAYASTYKLLSYKEKKNIKHIYNNYYVHIFSGKIRNNIKRFMFFISPNFTSYVLRKIKRHA